MLKVHEIVPTIQGEGRSMGRLVVFLRLSSCNLACSWCDTPFTWNWVGTKFAHPDKYDQKTETHLMTPEQVFAEVHKHGRNAVVVSGGEPLLQQPELILVCRLLKEAGYWIEVETNGTKAPDDELMATVDQFNCSPKLSNSGPDNSEARRIRPEALDKLASTEQTIFKFVISNETDMEEALVLVGHYKMKRVYLMAEGKTKEEQDSRTKWVFALSRKYGFFFTPRLHIQRWGDKRGC